MFKLIVGLGNPGPKYSGTRHNAGFDWIDAWAAQEGGRWRFDAKLNAELCDLKQWPAVLLLKPLSFMNRSGAAVAHLLNYRQWSTEQLLVVHDELDLPPGVARLKRGGGHGGHNGLRDIMQQLGNQRDFARLRLGIGHPGQASEVIDYVLKRAAPSQQSAGADAIAASLQMLPELMNHQWDSAVRQLHSNKTGLAEPPSQL